MEHRELISKSFTVWSILLASLDQLQYGDDNDAAHFLTQAIGKRRLQLYNFDLGTINALISFCGTTFIAYKRHQSIPEQEFPQQQQQQQNAKQTQFQTPKNSDIIFSSPPPKERKKQSSPPKDKRQHTKHNSLDISFPSPQKEKQHIFVDTSCSPPFLLNSNLKNTNEKTPLYPNGVTASHIIPYNVLSNLLKDSHRQLMLSFFPPLAFDDEDNIDFQPDNIPNTYIKMINIDKKYIAKYIARPFHQYFGNASSSNFSINDSYYKELFEEYIDLLFTFYTTPCPESNTIFCSTLTTPPTAMPVNTNNDSSARSVTSEAISSKKQTHFLQFKNFIKQSFTSKNKDYVTPANNINHNSFYSFDDDFKYNKNKNKLITFVHDTKTSSKSSPNTLLSTPLKMNLKIPSNSIISDTLHKINNYQYNILIGEIDTNGFISNRYDCPILNNALIGSHQSINVLQRTLLAALALQRRYLALVHSPDLIFLDNHPNDVSSVGESLKNDHLTPTKISLEIPETPITPENPQEHVLTEVNENTDYVHSSSVFVIPEDDNNSKSENQHNTNNLPQQNPELDQIMKEMSAIDKILPVIWPFSYNVSPDIQIKGKYSKMKNIKTNKKIIPNFSHSLYIISSTYVQPNNIRVQYYTKMKSTVFSLYVKEWNGEQLPQSSPIIDNTAINTIFSSPKKK